MEGLFLQGGGAKGAFQAGALYALMEMGIKPQVVAGTSIGAINGYYLYTGNMEEMKDLYINSQAYSENLLNEKLKLEKVLDNDVIINNLHNLKGNNPHIKAFYVNYVEVINGKLKERLVNICELEKQHKLNSIKFSSLLPYCSDGKAKTFDEILQDFSWEEQTEQFKKELIAGEYEGYNLDGGVLNNCLLTPFVENKVDKLYMIPLNHSFKIPEYIREIYKEEDIVLIEREKEFHPLDTINFKEEFLRELFYEGYNCCIKKCKSQ